MIAALNVGPIVPSIGGLIIKFAERLTTVELAVELIIVELTRVPFDRWDEKTVRFGVNMLTAVCSILAVVVISAVEVVVPVSRAMDLCAGGMADVLAAADSNIMWAAKMTALKLTCMLTSLWEALPLGSEVCSCLPTIMWE